MKSGKSLLTLTLILLLMSIQAYELAALPVRAANQKKLEAPKELFVAFGNLRRVGPLHMSDAVILRRGEEIVVLSDANDPIAEAELSGCLINLRNSVLGASSVSQGTILFTKGASLPALDDGRNAEHLRLKDGRMIDGRIQWVRNGAIGILERRNLKIIQFNEIATIVSPRAFDFVSNNISENSSTQNLHFSFSPTASTPPSQYLSDDGNPLKARLTKHSLASKAAMTAASAAAIGACFAIPIVISVVTPKLNNNSGGGSGGSSSSSSSSSSSGGSN